MGTFKIFIHSNRPILFEYELSQSPKPPPTNLVTMKKKNNVAYDNSYSDPHRSGFLSGRILHARGQGNMR